MRKIVAKRKHQALQTPSIDSLHSIKFLNSY